MDEKTARQYLMDQLHMYRELAMSFDGRCNIQVRADKYMDNPALKPSIKDGTIVLNISDSAAKHYTVSPEGISFSGRYSGVVANVFVDYADIVCVLTPEGVFPFGALPIIQGPGVYLSDVRSCLSGSGPTNEEEQPPAKPKPTLSVVK